MSRFIVSMVFCTLPLFAQAQAPVDPFQGLAAEMTVEERAAAGLGDLSPSQQEFLDAWLRKRFELGSSPDSVLPVEAAGAAVVATEAADAAAQEQAIEAEVERRVAEELAAAKASDTEDEASAQEPFEASVTGGFVGWSGKTLFKLDNGEVWRQRNDKVYRYFGDDPRVSFRRGLLGLWRMTVLSTGVSVAVAPVSKAE
ncbi:MAG: hypothetical protein L7T24_00090 [Luminiphilus sp.]|nr:hypothetical protein [Luminiphilus sp.]